MVMAVVAVMSDVMSDVMDESYAAVHTNTERERAYGYF